MEQTKRIRLNQEYRNKIAKRIELGLDQENTIEKEKYLQLREQIKPLQDKTWNLMYEIGRENYPQEDVDMAWHLQKKYDNVNTIAPDSCFHVAYMDTRKEDKLNYNGDVVEAKGQPMEVEEHFDFKVDGAVSSANNQEARTSGNKFAYAYFRDELKDNGLNPDIIAQQEGKQDNPHKTKHQDANDKFLGYQSSYGNDDNVGMTKTFNNQYLLDVIGTSYCRSRTIACTKDEYERLEQWRVAKGNLVVAHQKWIDTIQKQCDELKIGLKAYRYMSEAIELADALGIKIDEAELVRTNSTGLTIYNPTNLADRIKGMKNKTMTREQKILLRKQYEQSMN